MRKPIICICENKGTDQLRSNCEADQRLCFRYKDSTLTLLAQTGLCWTCSETTLLVFPRGGSYTEVWTAEVNFSLHIEG